MFHSPPRSEVEIQYPAARLAANTRKKDEIIPLLKNLADNIALINNLLEQYNEKVSNFVTACKVYLDDRKLSIDCPQQFSKFKKWFDDSFINTIDPFETDILANRKLKQDDTF